MQQFIRDGTRLAVHDLGGTGPPLLLVHGLAGYAGEWKRSAQLLGEEYQVFALDQRGHGGSDRRPGDVSRGAFVADCAEAIRKIGVGPVTLVGQSMGANTAMLVAAAHPDLVRSLVVIEGSPDGPDNAGAGAELAASIRRSLSAWQVPFADESAAQEFFRQKGFDPVVWTAGLERRDGGLRPRWDLETLVACMADLGSRNYWPQWRSIRCPTLVILGEHGIFPPGHGNEIIEQQPNASLIVIADAGHDVHLDEPEAWVAALCNSSAGEAPGVDWRSRRDAYASWSGTRQNRRGMSQDSWDEERRREVLAIIWGWDPVGIMGVADAEYEALAQRALDGLERQEGSDALAAALREEVLRMAQAGYSRTAADRSTEPGPMHQVVARLECWWDRVPPRRRQ